MVYCGRSSSQQVEKNLLMCRKETVFWRKMSDCQPKSQRVLPQRRAKQRLLESNAFLVDANESDDDEIKAPFHEEWRPEVKIEASLSDDEFEDEVTKPVRKRGRPKNNVKMSSKSTTSNQEQNEISHKKMIKKETGITDDEDEDDGNKFKCRKCFNTYATRGFLSLHMQTHSEDRLTCDLCPKTFANLVNLKEHLVYMHTEDGKILYKKKLERKKEYSKNRHRPYLEFRSVYSNKNRQKQSNDSTVPCLVCGLIFDNQNKLDIHNKSKCKTSPKQVVPHQRNFLCSVKGCVKMFKSQEKLNQHVSSHEKNQFPCSICGNFYKHPASLSRHVQRVHDEEGRKKAALDRKKYFATLKAKRLKKKKLSKINPSKESKTVANIKLEIDATREDLDPSTEFIPPRFEIIKVEPSVEQVGDDNDDELMKDFEDQSSSDDYKDIKLDKMT